QLDGAAGRVDRRLRHYLAVAVGEVADHVEAAHLAVELRKKAVVANPVGQHGGYPGDAFGPVVVGFRHADTARECGVPVHGLGWLGNVVGVRDAGGGVATQVVEPVAVRLDEQPAPGLLERDRGRRGVGPPDDAGNRGAFHDV